MLLSSMVSKLQDSASGILLEKEDKFFNAVETFESRLAKEVSSGWSQDDQRITVRCSCEEGHRGNSRVSINRSEHIDAKNYTPAAMSFVLLTLRGSIVPMHFVTLLARLFDRQHVSVGGGSIVRDENFA